MSGLCGWIGRLPDGNSPEEVLRGMARGLPVHGACQRKSYATRLGGLCLNARAGEGHWHEEGKVCAAIEGYPHWSNDSLVNLAANSGHGRALIHAYREHGIEFLSLIRGAYSLAILDIPARSLLLAIDRTGIGPMCYSGIDGGKLAFGSTVGSVAAHPSVEVTISPQSLFNPRPIPPRDARRPTSRLLLAAPLLGRR